MRMLLQNAYVSELVKCKKKKKKINTVTCLESKSELYEFVYKSTTTCGGLITLEDQCLALLYILLHCLLTHVQNTLLEPEPCL